MSKMSVAISVLAIIAPIAFAWYQGRKQQKISLLNQKKEKPEEIVKGYNNSKNMEDKIKLFSNNLQYFPDNESREEFQNGVTEYEDAHKNFIPMIVIGGDDNVERPDRHIFFEKKRRLEEIMDHLYQEFRQQILNLQHKIDELEASLMRE